MKKGSSALRRRRKPSLVTRLRIAWVFIAIFVGAAVYAGYVLVTLPQLRVRTVDVTIDGLAVTQREVLAAARIDRRANLWLLDTRTIAGRIEAIPYVDRVAIGRALPDRLTINVGLREPIACVQSAQRIVTVDREQRILQTGCARASAMQITLRSGNLGAPGSYANLPALATLLADGRELRAADLGVRSLGEDRFGQLVAVNERGIRLLFGTDSDLAQKVKLIAPVLAATRFGHAIRTIDVRAPATPTVEFR